MTTSDASWSGRLRKIGDLERPDHRHLGPGDACYFIGDYTPNADYRASDTNNIINNLKKKPSTRGTAQWRFKLRDIGVVAATIARSLKPDMLPGLTFVPIPPSKRRDDPEYDDRMLQVARRIPGAVDVRDLLFTAEPRDAAHENQRTRDPAVLKTKLGVDLANLAPPPSHIILLDDVITTGCSFVACRNLLRDHFPGVAISGVFVARRVLPASEFDIEF